MYPPFCFRVYLLSLGEKLLSFCLWKSAACDEVQGHSRGTAPGIEEKQELVTKTGFTLDAYRHCSASLLLSFLVFFQRYLIACPIKQWKWTEHAPTDCLLRVATAEMVSELILLSAWRVANNLFLMLVDEQVRDAKAPPSFHRLTMPATCRFEVKSLPVVRW